MHNILQEWCWVVCFFNNACDDQFLESYRSGHIQKIYLFFKLFEGQWHSLPDNTPVDYLLGDLSSFSLEFITTWKPSGLICNGKQRVITCGQGVMMKQCVRLDVLLHHTWHYQKHRLVPELEGQTVSLQLFSSFLLLMELQYLYYHVVLVALAESGGQGNSQGLPIETWWR